MDGLAAVLTNDDRLVSADRAKHIITRALEYRRYGLKNDPLVIDD
jgi:hypothetical protein